MVHEFHTRPGSDCTQPAEPTVDVPGALEHRVPFLEEEVREVREAVAAGDTLGTAKELADLVYGAYGAAWRFGIDLDVVLAEVHRSNMTKTPAPGDAKAIKGPGYSPADVAAALAREKRMRYPEGRPGWLGTWQTWPCGRCGRDVDDAGPHDCVAREEVAPRG